MPLAKPTFDEQEKGNRSMGCPHHVAVLAILATTVVAAVVATTTQTAKNSGTQDGWNGVGGCEGYWPPVRECLGPEGPAQGCPQHYVEIAWEDREDFLAKARALEKAISEADRSLQASCHEELSPYTSSTSEWKDELDQLSLKVISFRGISFSRIEEGAIVGSRSFTDESTGTCWPDGYVEHYVGEHHVRPSKRFQNFVQSFALDAFLASVGRLVQACEAQRGPAGASASGGGAEF